MLISKPIVCIHVITNKNAIIESKPPVSRRAYLICIRIYLMDNKYNLGLHIRNLPWSPLNILQNVDYLHPSIIKEDL